MLGIAQSTIVSTLRAGLAGEAAAYVHDASKYPAAAILQLPDERQGDLDALLQLAVRGAAGQLVPIRELVTLSDTEREQPIHHKDLLPVNFVVADMAGRSTARCTACSPCAARCALSPRPAAAAWANTSSASPTTPSATTRSSGTASGRSPTRPFATWAPPMRWASS